MSKLFVLAGALIGLLLLMQYVVPVYAFATAQNGLIELGQPDFTSNTSSHTQNRLASPSGLAFDSHGNLWVADYSNNRVLEFTCTSATSGCSNGAAASLVLGQPDFTTRTTATTQTGMWYPQGLAFDSHGNLWVADNQNARVLEFTCTSTSSCSNGAAASLVLGQSVFTSAAYATTQSGLSRPTDLAFDSQSNLWIADYLNNRVLEFTCTSATSGCSNGAAASLVLGQSVFNFATPATTQSGMYAPYGLAFDSRTNLWIADSSNNRVLEFTCTSTSSCSNGAAASLVLGQPDFTTKTAATTQSGLRSPQHLAFDSSGIIWVADHDNNRLLGYLGTTSTTTVTCSPSPVVVGLATTCTATVAGDSPTGTITWASSGVGAFSAPPSCKLSSGSCSISYTPSAATSSSTITATYGGDSSNTPGLGTISLTVVKAPTTTSVTCSPSPVLVGSATACTTSVTGYSPTSSVTFTSSSSGVTGFSTDAKCTLSAGTCQVTYTPSSAITPTSITASYGGDSNNEASSRVFSLNVTKSTTQIAITCSPSPVAPSSSSTCSATVTGYSPTGIVNFTSSSSTGTFSPVNGQCTLYSGVCSVAYSDSTTGTPGINGSYAGDLDNFGSTKLFVLTVQTSTTTTSTSTTTSSTSSTTSTSTTTSSTSSTTSTTTTTTTSSSTSTSASTTSTITTSTNVPEFPAASLAIIALMIIATVTLLSRKFYSGPLTR